MAKVLLQCTLFILFSFRGGRGVFIDTGIPYKDGPLKVGELSISETEQKSPLHAKAFYPLEVGEYPVIYFIGGLNGKVLVEFYEEFLIKVASHGFVVLGADYGFPIYDYNRKPSLPKLKSAVDKFLEELSWLQRFMVNKTECTLLWDHLGIMCHSEGCDSTLLMIERNSSIYKSTIFLEPASYHVKTKVNVKLPALMYGTEYSEEGHKCAIPGYDYDKYYDVWSCPRIVMNVASNFGLIKKRCNTSTLVELLTLEYGTEYSEERHNGYDYDKYYGVLSCPRIDMKAVNFGHCDILDPVPWKACHDTHFCKTTNNTSLLPGYKQFVQGVVSAFFITHLQGGSDMGYITNKTNIPLPLKELRLDLNC